MSNNYQFLDAYSSVQTAASSIVSGAHQPIVQVGSVLVSIPVSGTVTVNPASVSGTVGASIIGTAPVTQSGTWITSISGSVSINPASVSGTVGASIIGTAPVTMSGAWTASVVGGPISISSVAGAINIFAQPDSFVWGTASTITGTTAVSVLAAPGANLRNYITTIKVTNAAASAAIVDIKDSGGNVLDTGYAAASGGGWSTTFPIPIKQTNTNASVDAVPRSQASILVQITGYKAA